MAVALRRAGPAIIASAATVIASLLVLLVAELNSTKPGTGAGHRHRGGLGRDDARLLPALLVIFGRWIFWPAEPAYGSKEPTTRGLWARVGRRIAVRPRVVWVATAVILGAMTLGLTGLKASGLTTAESFAGHHPDSVAGQAVRRPALPGRAPGHR